MDKDEGKASFDARLQAARTRQGLDATPHDGGRSAGGASPWGMGLRVGVEMVAALAVGTGIGWALDRWLHTLPLFLVVFVLLGGAAGIANVWRMVGPPRRQAGG